MVTDDAIVVRAVQSFDAFYRSNYRQVLTCVFGLTEPAMAEDVTQEAFLAASQHWDEVGGLDSPGAWVRRVAINHAASAYHRRLAEARAVLRLSGRRHEIVPPMSEPAEEVWRAVRSLPRAAVVAVIALPLLFLDLRAPSRLRDTGRTPCCFYNRRNDHCREPPAD